MVTCRCVCSSVMKIYECLSVCVQCSEYSGPTQRFDCLRYVCMYQVDGLIVSLCFRTIYKCACVCVCVRERVCVCVCVCERERERERDERDYPHKCRYVN